MRFNVEDRIAHAVDLVYATYRDELSLLAPHLPDVRAIEVVKKERVGAKLFVVNRWAIKTRVPPMARGIVGGEEVWWLDHAEWDDDTKSVKWRYELPPALDPYAKAGGTNSFSAGGEAATRVLLDGEFRLDPQSHPLFPRMFAPFVPQVEEWIFSLIRPNLLAVNRALEKVLASRTV